MRVVIIGNGAAGIAAAGAIREKSKDAEVAVISDEAYFHYSRPRVIEFLAGKASAEEITVKKEKWYEDNNIGFLPGVKAEKINPSLKEILLSGGKTEKYDKLVIAAGAYSFVPPIPGSDSEGVFTLRTIEDAKKIMEHAKGKKKALAIGGGLLGIESAMSMSALGLEVTVAEVFDRLLPRQLDSEGASVLQSMLEKKGLKFLLPRKTLKIEKAGENLKIDFEGNDPAEAGLILISAGIRCNLALVKDSGIETDKGIKVNGFMETNVPDVYACGDIAEFNGRVYGIWPASTEQGGVAGLNAAGEKKEYKGTVMATKLKVAGIELASIGNIEKGEGETARTEKGEGFYRKLVFKEKALTGAILLGDAKDYSKLQKLIKSGEDASGLK